MIGRIIIFWFLAAIVIMIGYGLYESTRGVHELLGTQPGILEYAALLFMGFVALILIIAPFLKFPTKAQEI